MTLFCNLFIERPSYINMHFPVRVSFTGYITRLLQMSEDTIILFISSWRTTNKL